jgi:hypothetical protein
MNVVKHRPKAIELALMQAGYTLADIRGEREVHQYEEPPQGWAARLGAVPPHTSSRLAAGVLALGSLLAYETAMLTPLLVSLLAAYGLHLAGRVDADPVTVEHAVERPGMQHHEVQERLVQWNEWQRMEKEQQEREARKARRQSGGPSP